MASSTIQPLLMFQGKADEAMPFMFRCFLALRCTPPVNRKGSFAHAAPSLNYQPSLFLKPRAVP